MVDEVDPGDIDPSNLEEILGADPEDFDASDLSEEQVKSIQGSKDKSQEEVENIKIDEDDSEYSYSLPVENLPSNGVLYNFDYVDARGIKVKEEKKLSMVTQAQNLQLFHSKIREVVQACIKPDLLDFTIGDQMALFLFLRFQTFGSDYTFQFECPNCEFKHPKYTYDLSNLEQVELDGDYSEPTVIETEDRHFKMRLLRIRDEKELESFLKKHSSDFDMTRSELNISARYAGMLQGASDLQDRSLLGSIQYIENELTTKEFALIRSFANKYHHDIDMTANIQCPDCDQVYDYTLPMRGAYQEFYYPSPENIVNLDEHIK